MFVCSFRCTFRELSVAEAALAVEAAMLQLIRLGSQPPSILGPYLVDSLEGTRWAPPCVPHRLVLDQQRPLPDRRSYMLSVRHALTRKLTRSKTMQWWQQPQTAAPLQFPSRSAQISTLNNVWTLNKTIDFFFTFYKLRETVSVLFMIELFFFSGNSLSWQEKKFWSFCVLKVCFIYVALK